MARFSYLKTCFAEILTILQLLNIHINKQLFQCESFFGGIYVITQGTLQLTYVVYVHSQAVFVQIKESETMLVVQAKTMHVFSKSFWPFWSTQHASKAVPGFSLSSSQPSSSESYLPLMGANLNNLIFRTLLSGTIGGGILSSLFKILTLTRFQKTPGFSLSSMSLVSCYAVDMGSKKQTTPASKVGWII